VLRGMKADESGVRVCPGGNAAGALSSCRRVRATAYRLRSGRWIAPSDLQTETGSKMAAPERRIPTGTAPEDNSTRGVSTNGSEAEADEWIGRRER